MLVEARKRFFMRHQLRLRAYRKNGEPLRLFRDDDTIDLYTVVKAAVAAGRAELVLKQKDIVTLTKVTYVEERKMVVLLFRRSDPDASPPVFEHVRTKKLRKSDKRGDEGMAVSAHVFIRTSSISDAATPTYHAIVEEMPGLGRTYMEKLLSEIVSAHTYSYTDRHGEEKQTHTLLELLGLKAESLGNAMRESTVQNITLVRPGSLAGLDTEGMAVPRDQRMKVLLRATPEKTIDVLKKIIPWAKQNNWKDILVRVDMPEERSRVVSVARSADASDVLFVRSEQVTVVKDLDLCTDDCNPQLVEEAEKIFLRERL
ncbi:hypothetical protein [Methylobacterium sp.]|uniref:hypothetical protein n=1 Tax=Methylobacterium sp. TaxID=409 RepID=UPI003B00B59D